MTLYDITYTVNFLALMSALWLGLYIVTRSPRSPISWLTALTLWSLGGLFMNILLALNPPPIPTFRPSFLRFLFPFWASGTYEHGANAWLQGWSVIPSIVFWHHATTMMRPGKMTGWRWIRVLSGYALGIAAMEVQAFTQILFSVEGGDPLYLNSLQAGPLYFLFGATLILFIGLSVINLARSARVAGNDFVRRQLTVLVAATLITGLIVPVSLISSGLDVFPTPMVVMTLVLSIYIIMVGYGVARYSALVEGRTITRDFLYNLVLITLITLLYLFAARLLVASYKAPAVIAIFIPLLAIFTHTAMTITTRIMDRFFFQTGVRRLRSNLNRLSRLAGESQLLTKALSTTFFTLCNSIRATYGLIFILDRDHTKLLSSYRWRMPPVDINPVSLTADDVIHLETGQLDRPLQEAALLVPLYAESEQVGALVFGRPTNGIRYATEDVDNILHPADRIADLILIEHRKSEYLSRLSVVAEEHRSQATPSPLSLPVDSVEKALRNLYDYSYLGDSHLAEMETVRRRMLDAKLTHIEKGKIVQSVVLEALEQMRPARDISRDPPPREWYAYIILHDAYLDGIQNRDIMSKLYISEGTFNRTRRAAIRSLARTLAEMEFLE